MLPESFKRALEHYAARTPKKTFCHFTQSRQSLDYADLYHQVTDCMLALRTAGIGPGSRVAIHLPPSPKLIVYLLAVMNTGAVAVPVGYSLHRSLVESMVRILDPHMIIAAKQEIGEAGSTENPPELLVQQRPSSVQDGGAKMARLGIFTSGSTERPKCSLLTQSNLLAGASFVIEAHAVTSADTVACCMPLEHINGVVTTILTPLLSGGSVVFLEGAFSARSFMACMQRHKATWFSAAPVHYQLLIYPGTSPAGLEACRFGRSAAAPLKPEVQRRFEELYGIPVIQTMGLTECSGQVFSNPMPPKVSKVGSVGRPVGNEVEVVDSGGRPMGAGKTGEIRVRGPNVMRGYLGDAQANSETIRDGWLYTGDLAYRDEDGYFFITGRKKLIAIIGGENVSLLAVENAVRDLPFVEDAAALARSSDVTGEVIDLYYTGAGNNREKDLREIQLQLLKLLPNHHALGQVKKMDALPRSTSGKLLRSQLAHQ